MNREVHVRICEGLGVKLPGPTRHLHPWPASRLIAAYRRIAAVTGAFAKEQRPLQVPTFIVSMR